MMLTNTNHLMRVAFILMHNLYTGVSRHRQMKVAHQRPCRLQKA